MESNTATPRPWVLGQSDRPHTGRSALLAKNPKTGVFELVADFGTSPSRTIIEAQANAALSLAAVNAYNPEREKLARELTRLVLLLEPDDLLSEHETAEAIHEFQRTARQLLPLVEEK